MQYGILYSLIKDDRYTSYACEIVSLNCSQLDTVSSYNYLGVVIDDGLIFDTFICLSLKSTIRLICGYTRVPFHKYLRTL